MIETEEQRRWWFATHPEYSRSYKGAKKPHKDEQTEDHGKVRPEDVDAYVDHALQYVHGPVAGLLKSVKRNFGTEGERKRPEQRLAYSDELASRTDDQSLASEHDSDAEKPGFWHAVAKGIDNTLEEWQRWLGIGARLPPKGTQERAKIEADRRRGRDAKMKEELADIQAGGKGSEVWSKKELESIRQTGEFPPDTVWHHDPTVANRPDLAADPRVVHPVRGGRKGHFEIHGRDWRNPK